MGDAATTGASSTAHVVLIGLLLLVTACLGLVLCFIASHGPSRTKLLQQLGLQRGMRRSASFFPPQFMCPITGEVMKDPVTTSDGHAFERTSIERWLLTHSTSPMTGMPLEHTGVAPAIALRQLIENEMRARGLPYS